MAQTNKMVIELLVKDEVTKQFKKLDKQSKKVSKNVTKDFAAMALKVGAFVIAVKKASNAMSFFIESASKVEQLKTRLKVLTGSMEEGNALFEEMARLAGRVPQTFDEITEAAVTMRAVVTGGNAEVIQLMPIIADLAAATGISVVDTTSQMVRMYSAGAASADMFRERGVLAMLGFQAGVSVNAEETMRRVVAAWEDGNSKFRGATEELAKTHVGQVSMMQDAWFKFAETIGSTITKAPVVTVFLENITNGLNDFTEAIKMMKGEIERSEIDVLTSQLEDLDRLMKETGKGGFSFLFGEVEAKQQLINLQNERIVLITRMNELKKEAIELSKKEEAVVTFKVRSESKAAEFAKKRFEKEEELRKNALDSGLNAIKLMAGENKTAAVAFKAIQLTRSIINTAEGVTEALPNIPLAILVGAMGAAETAAIASTSFATGTDRVPAGGGATHAGEIVIPRTFAEAIRDGRLSLSGGEEGGGRVGGDIILNFFDTNVGDEGVEAFAEELGFEVERALKTARGV